MYLLSTGTYSAPIYVNVRYTRQRQIVVKNGVQIGRIPIMLLSDKCILHGKSEDELAKLKECSLDPVITIYLAIAIIFSLSMF